MKLNTPSTVSDNPGTGKDVRSGESQPPAVHGGTLSVASECAVIVPLCNEEQNLPTLHVRLTATLKRLAIPYEIIYIDNGSTDRTAVHSLDELHLQDSAVRGIILSRKFSTQAALSAGLEATNSRAVITIDGNLEDPSRSHSAAAQCLAYRIRGRLGSPQAAT